MDIAGIRKSFDTIFDSGLIHFGPLDYLRDFEMYFDLASQVGREILRYRFINCVRADTSTTLDGETWRKSLDDRLIGDLASVQQPYEGWVWATRYGDMYPGARLAEHSEEADHWSRSVGIPFHEATIEAPPVRVRLIFSDLTVEPAVVGKSIFTIR